MVRRGLVFTYDESGFTEEHYPIPRPLKRRALYLECHLPAFRRKGWSWGKRRGQFDLLSGMVIQLPVFAYAHNLPVPRDFPREEQGHVRSVLSLEVVMHFCKNPPNLGRFNMRIKINTTPFKRSVFSSHEYVFILVHNQH